VIYNPKSNYDKITQEHWKEFSTEFYNHFGRENISKGIKKEAFDSWWKQIIRNLSKLKQESKRSSYHKVNYSRTLI